MLMNSTSRLLAHAFAIGYYHGRAIGNPDNPYHTDEERLSYEEGYDAGVTAYCDEAHPEDVEIL